MAVSSYYSIAYLALFLPIVIILYTVMPKKVRWLVLLLSSWWFFWCVSGKLLVYILLSSLSIHHGGIWLSLLQKERDSLMETAADKERKKELRSLYRRKQRMAAAAIAGLNIGILVFLKYGAFFGGNLNSLLALLKIPAVVSIPSLAVPIGISFYTLQAVSYIMDVYHEKIQADRNMGRLALYLSFFPQLMEGPICRYSETAMQLWRGERIRHENLVSGTQRMVFGMMKKIVIADRLNQFIKNVFTNNSNYDGTMTAIAVVLYTCQLYMEFSGTMDMALGCSEIFGMRMPENFRQPFFSRSISEFWQRWHITLGTWFKDYIFYPLSMANPMKKLTSRARKKLGNHYGPLIAGSAALFVVWLCNGLWHGAGWHYIFFGMYHFVLILAGNMTEPLFRGAAEKLHIRRESVPYRAFQVVRTAALVCVGELFFRADSLRIGLSMFRNMVTGLSFASIRNGTVFQAGMDRKDFVIVLIGVLIVLVNSVMKEKGIQPRKWLAGRPAAVRWAVCYALILFVVVFGAYGTGYVPLDPIYANF